MIETIENFFVNMGGSFLAVMLLSMLPVAEARIGVPFGMSVEVWGERALSPFMSFVAGLLGSSIIAFFILLLLKPIFSRLKKTKAFRTLIEKLETKFKKQSKDLEDPEAKEQTSFGLWLAVMLFVALPAPMTGIWAGCGIASFTKLNILQSFSAIFVGNLIACLLILFVCTIFKDSVMFLLLASVVLTILGVAIYFLSKKKKDKVINIDTASLEN